MHSPYKLSFLVPPSHSRTIAKSSLLIWTCSKCMQTHQWRLLFLKKHCYLYPWGTGCKGRKHSRISDIHQDQTKPSIEFNKCVKICSMSTIIYLGQDYCFSFFWSFSIQNCQRMSWDYTIFLNPIIICVAFMCCSFINKSVYWVCELLF